MRKRPIKNQSPVLEAMRPDLSRTADAWFQYVCLPPKWRGKVLENGPGTFQRGYHFTEWIIELQKPPYPFDITDNLDNEAAFRKIREVGDELGAWLVSIEGVSSHRVAAGGGKGFWSFRYLYSGGGFHGEYLIRVIPFKPPISWLFAMIIDVPDTAQVHGDA